MTGTAASSTTKDVVIAPAHLQEYYHEYPNYETRIKFLTRLLNLSMEEDNEQQHEQQMISLDFFYYGLNFAKESKFSLEQSVVFFQLMKETHDYCMGNPFVRLQNDYEYFKDHLLRKCVYRPPRSEKIFDYNEIKLIHDYMLNTYFRHYTMYKYVLTRRPVLNLTLFPNDYDLAEAELPSPLQQLLNQTDKGAVVETKQTEASNNNPFISEESMDSVEDEEARKREEEERQEASLLAALDPQILSNVERVVLELIQPKLDQLRGKPAAHAAGETKEPKPLKPKQ